MIGARRYKYKRIRENAYECWLRSKATNNFNILRRTEKKKVLVMMIVITTAMATNALGLEWIVNGSFETPDIVDGSWAVFTSVDGWNISWTSFSYQEPDEGPEGPELELGSNPLRYNRSI